MTLNDLTVNFAHLNREALLEDWQWLLSGATSPVLITVTGNAFVQHHTSGTVSLLDVGSPDVIPIAESSLDFSSLLQQPSFVSKFFEVPLVIELKKISSLQPGRVYGFKKLPTMGGDYDPNNFEPTDIEVHFSICGQLQQKIIELPAGTSMGAINIIGSRGL